MKPNLARKLAIRLLIAFLCSVRFFIPLARAQQQEAPPSAMPSPTLKPGTAAAAFHEDLTSISLDGSNLVPEPPVLGQKDDRPDSKYTRELLQVNWRGYDPIDLYVLRPKGVAKPPVIIYLYSYPSGTERFMNHNWCTGATSGGYAAVGFVSALTGHRLEHRPPKEWFVSEMQESLATSTHDVQMVLNFLADRGGFDLDHVGMFGEGSGGTITILASAADPRIKAVEALSPWGDWPNWVAKSKIIPEEERPAYMKPEFLDRIAPLDPVRWLPKVKAQVIRIQDVRPNPMVPEICQKNLEAAAPENAVVDQFGDGRAFLNVMISQGLPFGWLKEQLDPKAKSVRLPEKIDRIHYYKPANPPLSAPGSSPSSQPGESKPTATSSNQTQANP